MAERLTLVLLGALVLIAASTWNPALHLYDENGIPGRILSMAKVGNLSAFQGIEFRGAPQNSSALLAQAIPQSGDLVVRVSSNAGIPVEGVQATITGSNRTVRAYTSSKGEVLMQGVLFNFTVYEIRLENGYNAYPIENATFRQVLPGGSKTYLLLVNVSVLGNFQPLNIYVPGVAPDGAGAFHLRSNAHYVFPFTVGVVGGEITCPVVHLVKGSDGVVGEAYAYKTLGAMTPTGSLQSQEGLVFPNLRAGDMVLMQADVATGAPGKFTLTLDDFCGVAGKGVNPVTAEFVVQ